MTRLLGGTGAAIAAKLATGFAVAALAAAGAGAVTEAALTGSLNPNDWGQQVTQQVQTCKDTLRASGVHGIGPCVSAFAKQHGPLVRAEHQASNARTNHGKGEDNGNGNSNGNGNGHGKPSDVPHGKPSTLPPAAHS